MRKHEQPNSGALSSSIVLQRVLARCKQCSLPDRRVLSKLHRIASFRQQISAHTHREKDAGSRVPRAQPPTDPKCAGSWRGSASDRFPRIRFPRLTSTTEKVQASCAIRNPSCDAPGFMTLDWSRLSEHCAICGGTVESRLISGGSLGGNVLGTEDHSASGYEVSASRRGSGGSPDPNGCGESQARPDRTHRDYLVQ
jgi:hypothetical protein